MKALTLRAEFADLVLAGTKIVENRSWGNHKTLAGQRIAIHRGGPGGAIVCTVVIKAIVDVAVAKRLFKKQRKHISGPLCWILTNMVPVVPVPCSGKLSLWEIPVGVELIPLEVK